MARNFSMRSFAWAGLLVWTTAPSGCGTDPFASTVDPVSKTIDIVRIAVEAETARSRRCSEAELADAQCQALVSNTVIEDVSLPNDSGHCGSWAWRSVDINATDASITTLHQPNDVVGLVQLSYQLIQSDVSPTALHHFVYDYHLAKDDRVDGVAQPAIAIAALAPTSQTIYSVALDGSLSPNSLGPCRQDVNGTVECRQDLADGEIIETHTRSSVERREIQIFAVPQCSCAALPGRYLSLGPMALLLLVRWRKRRGKTVAYKPIADRFDKSTQETIG